MSVQIVVNLAQDTTQLLLQSPGLTVTGATVEHVNMHMCEAVVHFSDGATLSGIFNLPDDVPPVPKLIRTIESLLLDACRKVEAAIARGVPSLGHTVH